MQRKISNIKYKELNYSSSGRLSSVLHSIPIILLNMKNKSNVLYSIPCSCVLALLLVGISCLVNIVLGSNGSCYAADTTSASLSLSNPNMTSSAITPGNTTTVSTNVSVKVDNAESYSLILKVDSTTLKNGNTTITAGNVVNDNTWGYKWDKDNTSTYKAPTTTGTNLTVPTLTNNSANFEGILTFGAKFSTSAEAGHYRGSGTLSLVAEPKVIAGAQWFWSNDQSSVGIYSGITTMQEMTPEVCNQVSTPTASSTVGATNAPLLKLTDSRDNNEYTIAKLPDGKCWMVDNLSISGKSLSSLDSNVSGQYNVPATLTTPWNSVGGNTPTADYCYYSSKTGYTYYTWYTATAGYTTSTAGDAPSSICPKGWKLPSGGTDGEYSQLVTAAQGIGNTELMASSPYNFTNTGWVNGGEFGGTTSVKMWWTGTASNSEATYYFAGSQKSTSMLYRGIGLAIRCVAQ